jgi:hypothetical protein
MIEDQVHSNASPICQNMVNLIMGYTIWRCPDIFMDVMMWEHHTVDCEIFRCGKVYYTNSIINNYFV